MISKFVTGLLSVEKWVNRVQGFSVRSNLASVPDLYPLSVPTFASMWGQNSVKNERFYWLFVLVPDLPTFLHREDLPRTYLLSFVPKLYPLLVFLRQKWVRKVGTNHGKGRNL